MDWMAIIGIATIILANLGTVIMLHIHLDNRTNETVKAIYADIKQFREDLKESRDDMKDFHSRLVLQDQEFKTRMAEQDREFKLHMQYYHKKFQ